MEPIANAAPSQVKKYEPPTINEIWDEQIGTRGVYLLELG